MAERNSFAALPNLMKNSSLQYRRATIKADLVLLIRG